MSSEYKNDAESNGSPRYLIPESVYDYNHPEVIKFTRIFRERAEKEKVLSNINTTIAQCQSRAAAEIMAAIWYEFSCHTPRFLALAVSQTRDPERQHHLIQIAFDELGGHNKERIHSLLFLKAVNQIGIQLLPRLPLFSIRNLFETLNKGLIDAKNEHVIIGLLMSFEIVAQENIEMLFECLSFDDAARETLATTLFFKIHRQDETEHIRHSVANFLRFCRTASHRDDFLEGFDRGIEFWGRFWDQSARLINVATNPRAKAS